MTQRSQDLFWTKYYAEEYIKRNSGYDEELGVSAWESILKNTELNSGRYLEIGCNIGRNLNLISKTAPLLRPSVVEINHQALSIARSRYKIEQFFSGPVQEAAFESRSFDLVFTSGVLIHIPPDDLLDTMRNMYNWSSKYVLMIEYFNRTPVQIEYRGAKDVLFKRDFGGLFLDNFNADIVDYGFLWGRIYDEAGFDDVTWWLFEKREP